MMMPPVNPIGYVVLTSQPDGSWQDDWDGEIHPSRADANEAVEAAWASLGYEGATLGVIYRADDPKCRSCGTTLDADGACQDPACTNYGIVWPWDAEVIVGPRYRIEDVRVAAGRTAVLEVGIGDEGGGGRFASQGPRSVPQPVSGPISRKLTDGRWVAVCLRCTDASKPYVRKNEMALFKWAHSHRCP